MYNIFIDTFFLIHFKDMTDSDSIVPRVFSVTQQFKCTTKCFCSVNVNIVDTLLF